MRTYDRSMTGRGRSALAAGILVAAVGCSAKAPLPPGLEQVDPGAPIGALARASEFHRFDSTGSLLVSEHGYLCFDRSGEALGLGGALLSVVYRRAGERGRRACFDETVDRPPPGWKPLGRVRCGGHREAYFTIDGRWGARVKDGPQAAELALLADADLRADARRASASGCTPLP
jgi:hypothetical protein